MRKKGGGLLGRLSSVALLGKKGRSGSVASSAGSATSEQELYEYKGDEKGSFSQDAPNMSQGRFSPEPVRIKKRISKNAQILDSWNGLEVSATPELQTKDSGSSSSMNADQDQV